MFRTEGVFAGAFVCTRRLIAATVVVASHGCDGQVASDRQDTRLIANTVNVPRTPSLVRSRQNCAGKRCEIVLSQVGTISDTDAAIHLGERPSVQVSSRGDLIANGVNQILRYETSGAFVTAVGRNGAGPGEFMRLGTITLGPGDSVHAWDADAKRLSVFTPDIVFVRSLPLPHAPALVLADGSYLVAAQIRTRDRIGYPMHRVAATGEFERSFGSDVPQYRSDLRLLLTRVVGPGRDGSIWAAPPGQYRIERWDPVAGNRLESISLESSWFRESAQHVPALSSRPLPIITALWEDSLGFVWILSRDADSRWAASANPEAHRPVFREEMDAIYDWVLEVIDPDTRQAVTSIRFSDERRTRSPSRLLVSSEAGATMETVHKVWKPHLTLKEDLQ
jgi:hypothetical protein